MSNRNFRAYNVALEFFWECEKIKCKKHLHDQLCRAASSIALNLNEGSAKQTAKDRRNFYYTALGSLRECQAVLDLLRIPRTASVHELADLVGAYVFKLCRSQFSADTEPPKPSQD